MKRYLALTVAACAALIACATTPSLDMQREAQARMQMGMTYLEQRNLSSAMRELTKASELDPVNPEIDVALGLAYQARGDLGKAAEYFRSALRKKPGYAEAHNDLGIVLSQLGRGEEALREFEAAASNVLYPTPEWAYYNMGEEFRRRGNAVKAEEMYRRSMALNHRYMDSYLRLALIQGDRGRWEEAARTLEACVAAAPTFAPAWLDLGRAYLSLGRRQDAEKAFQSALTNSADPALRKQASDFLGAPGSDNK